MEIKTILFTVFGVIVAVLLIRKFFYTQKTNLDSYSDENNEWSMLISSGPVKILSKYAGEIRFGPAYIHLRSEPTNIFEKQIFGDWIYKTDNGVYLQKWNSKQDAKTDLIFYDTDKNQIDVIEYGINSFFWEIEKDAENNLTLISDNGKQKQRIKITNANKVYSQ